jgi:uncharacterized protein involved in exopolysaccharide biosynthesis
LQAALDGLLHTKPGSNTLTLESFATNRYKVSRLQAEFDGITGNLVQARTAYEVARATYSGRVSNLYVVQPAYPVGRKVKPMRTVIVISSALAAFILTALAALVLEWLRGGSVIKTDQDAEPTT